MQEMLVEDLAEVMGYAGTLQLRGGETMAPRMLEDLFTFLLVLMGSRDYIRNPYLHAKMSKASKFFGHCPHRMPLPSTYCPIPVFEL